MHVLRVLAIGGLLALLVTPTPHAQGTSTAPGAGRTDEPRTTPGLRLAPTAHPALPATPAQYWLAPDLSAQRSARGRATVAAANLVKAVTAIGDSDYAAALRLIDPVALTSTPVAAYAHYYKGTALVALQRYPE